MPEGQSTILLQAMGRENKKQAGRVLEGQIWDQMPSDPSRHRTTGTRS